MGSLLGMAIFVGIAAYDVVRFSKIPENKKTIRQKKKEGFFIMFDVLAFLVFFVMFVTSY